MIPFHESLELNLTRVAAKLLGSPSSKTDFTCGYRSRVEHNLAKVMLLKLTSASYRRESVKQRMNA